MIGRTSSGPSVVDVDRAHSPNNLPNEGFVQIGSEREGAIERDDVSMPNSVKERVANEFGDDVANAFGDLMPFDPPPA